MRHISKLALITAALSFGSATFAQTTAEGENADAFTPENAIVNTSVPFARGAREAQQNLRGSFGWANFQEGMVKGVYFRFDPDGYGRFSLSARLDTDVFEVICRPRTYFCVARKGGMTVMLSNLGEPLLKLDDTRASDVLSVFDGNIDTPLKIQVMQPLPFATETLLINGGELVIRRSGEIVSETSLVGFEAVISYLRWISARQNYAVLPRDWPLPDMGPLSTAMQTQISPDPIPQGQTIDQVGSGSQYANTTEQTASPEEMRAEIDRLTAELAAPAAVEQPLTPSMQPENDRLTKLEAAMQELLQKMNTPQVAATPVTQTAPLYPLPASSTGHWTQSIVQNADDIAPVTEPVAITTQMPVDELPSEVSHLTYLVQQMGLDPQTALVLMQFIQPEANADGMTPPETALQRSYHDSLAESILADLEAELVESNPTIITADDPGQPIDNVKKGDGVEVQEGVESDEVAAEIDSTIIENTEPASTEQDAPMSIQPTETNMETTEFQSLTDYFLAIQKLN